MTATPDPPASRAVRKIRMRAVGFLAAAIVAGVAAVFLVKVYLDQARQHLATPIDTRPVVVMTQEVQGGHRLAREQLAILQWPGQAPPGTFQNIDEVVGHTARQMMVKGEPVLRDHLASKGQGQGLAAILAEGARAMAVKVDQVVGIAGFVQPGDRVDVLTTIATDEESRAAMASKASRVSKIILQDIRVLAVGEHLSTDGQKPVKVQVVTLEVQPDQSERLALASQYGTIQLTMRARVDRVVVATDGVTPLSLLALEPRPTLPPPPAAIAKAEPPPSRRQRPRARTAPVEKTAPETPVVEILRGTTKVEERKIKSVGGNP